jgi:predicted kinase
MKHSELTGCNYEQSLIIIRGLPGSGKSTLASKLLQQKPGAIHIETDMWWYRNADKEYRFNMELLNQAHRWAQQTAEAFMSADKEVIVSNTNLTFKEAKPYIHFASLLGINIQVYTTDRDVNYGNIHGVPKEVMERMYHKMESHETFMDKVYGYRPD